MTHDDFRRRAAAVRDLPLVAVLLARGAVRDRHDRCKWHTEQGPLSITDAKFINWSRHRGGGGAIDLVMHLAAVDCGTAVTWLEQHFAVGRVTAAHQSTTAASGPPCSLAGRQRPLRLPVPNDHQQERVLRYLTECRRLATALLRPLLESGRLYADGRGNAVFLLVMGKANRPVGAELRGTGPQAWRGMAPGTRKDLGYFWTGARGAQDIVLCESAIDAISCFMLYPERICISTSGVRANPPWLPGLITRGYRIYCGFDADEPGDAAASQMLALHPTVERLRPPTHDWNDSLASNP
jgi:hypothetical protein